MMLRFIHAVKTKKTKDYGSFKLVGNKDQADAALSLYGLFIQSKGDPSMEVLTQAMHRLFDALLRPDSLSEDVIACPTDQMLFLSNLLSDGRYRLASAVTSLCSALQFCFRSVLIQIARLQAISCKLYVPIDPLTDAGDNSREGTPKKTSSSKALERTHEIIIDIESGSDEEGTDDADATSSNSNNDNSEAADDNGEGRSNSLQGKP